MATNDVCIPIEELANGQSDNVASPRSSSSSSNSTNTHTQPQAPRPQSKKGLEDELLQLSKTFSNPISWSIFKVPHGLRQVNEKAYEPRVISIGPYHHGKEHLKKMEIIKKSCLSRIIGESRERAEEFVKAMKDMEEDVRKCYADALDDIDSDGLVKMMILDGCFIVNLFQEDDSLSLLAEKAVFLECEIYCDLLLLENQLPFSVLFKLYKMMINMSEVEEDEFARLALSYFSVWMRGSLKFPKKLPEDFKHLLGLVYDSWIPQPTATRVEGQDELSNVIRSARELEEAGIKFVKKDIEVGKDEDEVESSLFDIEFTEDAKLIIPTFVVNDDTELILRNFMAYEQLIPIGEPTYICDYVKFLDNLIDSGKDVQLLRHSGVIVNWLGDDEAVAQMFNKLHDFISISADSFYYSKIYGEVNKHCQKRRNVWKAKLKKDYFNYPWSLISVIAAAVLLLLTVVQTIFSVLSYAHPQ